MEFQLTVHDLTLQYGRHSILDRLEFDITRGQRVALLGANGAGKTTLLRCISKALKPSGGTIFLDNRDLKNLSPRDLARSMAVVPQETGIDFDFTVEETVLMGRLPYLKRFAPKENRERSIARQAMSMTGVSHLAKRSITTLSGGEKQRVIIARALCQEPQILLLDEPTANLDLGYQHGLLELIAELNRKQGITVVAAIHDLNLAARFFDRMLLLSGGKILACGKAEEVIAPGLIKTAYGVDTFVYRHPLTGSMQVCVRNDTDGTGVRRSPIHVVGGGEEALPVLEYLRQTGCPLSVGPVTPEDSSHRFATFYGLPLIEVPPFSPISDRAHRAHLQLIKNAALTVVPPIPFGIGNLRNLEAVETALEQGCPVAVLDRATDKLWDFTDGEAVLLLKRLIGKGAYLLQNVEQIVMLLGKEQPSVE
ncbi:MAG: ABC transporter ATP-binding protein [Firmicutes bacterium]|nr:ABC transporter ATP-binding protein [Bacillota bacterium]